MDQLTNGRTDGMTDGRVLNWFNCILPFFSYFFQFRQEKRYEQKKVCSFMSRVSVLKFFLEDNFFDFLDIAL